MSIFSKIGAGIKKAGDAIGSIVKKVAPTVLPFVGGLVGTFIAPGAGTAVGAALGKAAGASLSASGNKTQAAVQSLLNVAKDPANQTGLGMFNQTMIMPTTIGSVVKQLGTGIVQTGLTKTLAPSASGGSTAKTTTQTVLAPSNTQGIGMFNQVKTAAAVAQNVVVTSSGTVAQVSPKLAVEYQAAATVVPPKAVQVASLSIGQKVDEVIKKVGETKEIVTSKTSQPGDSFIDAFNKASLITVVLIGGFLYLVFSGKLKKLFR